MKHPYTQFENTVLWKAISVAIADLEKNNDLKLVTAPGHVIGYLCQQLVREKLVDNSSVVKK